MNTVVFGREREITAANGFLDAAAERSCGLLLVGEPGIGKTTIWSEVMIEAERRGYAALVSRPSQGEAELPLAALADLLAPVDDHVLKEIPDPQRIALEHSLRRIESASAVDPTAVALAVLGVLRRLAASTPTIVAIDDLQWADAPSLRALTFAFRRLGDARVGFVATARTGFDHELTLLEARDPKSLERIEIGGLGKRDLEQLVRDRTDRALTPLQLGRIVKLSGGSPLYALELAASEDPGSGIPQPLAATLRSRLAGLSDAARAAGLVAATLGRTDRAVFGEEYAAGLAELRAAGVVDDRSGASWFTHPLLASTLIDLHSAEERRLVHLSLAAILDDPDERALHLGRGTESQDEAVAAELELAAARLDARGAPEAAATVAERAAALTPSDNAAGKTRRLLLASDLYQAAGEGRDHVMPLLESLAETLPAGPEMARVLIRLGWLGAQIDTLTTPEVLDYQERALAQANGASDVIVAAHAILARMQGISGNYTAGLDHARLAVEAGATLNPNGMFPSPSGELAMALFFAGEGLDEVLFEEAIEAESSAARGGEPYHWAELKYALALFNTGQLARARILLLELLRLSVELERVRSTTGCILHLLELEVRAGNLPQAQVYAAEFVQLDRQLRGDASGEWYPSGLVAMHVGRVDEARRVLEAGIDYSRAIESTIWFARHRWALGQLELSLGNLTAARELLVPLVPLLRETGLGEWSVHPVHPDAIEALVGLGEIDEAADLAAELESYGRRLDRPWGIATAARSAALIASARGKTDEALESAKRALVEHERLDWPFERARTLFVTGGILRRLGRRRDAATTLAEARQLFGAIGTPLWVKRVDAEEQRLGGRRATTCGLTPTEDRVARLAGEGLRNTEIAARLFVTPKTVEATLSRVYRKLDMRSRTELARWLVETDGEAVGG